MTKKTASHQTETERDVENRNLYNHIHLAVLSILAKYIAPCSVAVFLAVTYIHPGWQTFVCSGVMISASIFWIYTWMASKRGNIPGSFPVILGSIMMIVGTVMLTLKGVASAAVLPGTTAVVYASLSNRKNTIATSASLLMFLLLSEAVHSFEIYPALELSTTGRYIASSGFSLITIPTIAFILLQSQKLNSTMLSSLDRLNSDQTVLIETAASSGTTLDEAVDDIRNVSESFSQQADDQSTAIAQITNTMIHVRQLAADTADIALTTKSLAESVHNKSAQASVQIRGLEDEIDKVVESTHVAQSEFDELASQAQSVGSILRTNREIAGQIKILAVNASIQAAKAGEFGSGFRVVATELKAMILRTDKSISDSRKLLEDIQRRARQSSSTVKHTAKMLMVQFNALGQTGNMIEQISSEFKNASSQVGRIAESAQEQQQNLDQIGNGMDYIDYAASELARSTVVLGQSVDKIIVTNKQLKRVLSGNR